MHPIGADGDGNVGTRVDEQSRSQFRVINSQFVERLYRVPTKGLQFARAKIFFTELDVVDISPKEVRAIWTSGYAGIATSESSPPSPLIGVSCHTPEEVKQAAENAADFAVFAPVFEKHGATAAGLDLLGEACPAPIPVLALGGVTLDNAQSCLRAGAAGIAGIRLFQENNIAEVARKLRKLGVALRNLHAERW